MNRFRYFDKPEPPSEIIDLIDKYVKVIPYLTTYTGSAESLYTPILSHPDLHLNNVFIDPTTNKITAIIDWQSARVAPRILQAEIPRMFRHITSLAPGWVLPQRPSNYDSLSPEEKLKADKLHESALLQKYYEVLAAKKNPCHYSAHCHNDTVAIPFIEPLRIITGAWQNREVFKLRASLMRIVDRWAEFRTSSEACPISFTDEERDLHADELRNLVNIEEMMQAFQDEGILPADGRVDPEDFEHLAQMNQIQRERYLSLAEDSSEREAMEKTWPYQDWPEDL